MLSLSRNLASVAACSLAFIVHIADAEAVPVSYTDFGVFQSTTSALTTETFDAEPWRPVGGKPQGLTNLGVTWTAANQLYASNISRSSPGSVSSNDGVGPGADIFDWIEAVLPANVTAVGAWITSHNMAHLSELLAYDALNNLLGSVSLGNTGHAFAFLGLTTDTAIARVRFASTHVTNPIGDDLTVDDFSFGRAVAMLPVPEPSTLALFGAALVGLGLRRRRKAAPGAVDRRTLADIGIDPGAALPAGRVRIEELRCAPRA